MQSASRVVQFPSIENFSRAFERENALSATLDPEMLMAEMAHRLQVIERKVKHLSRLIDEFVDETPRNRPVYYPAYETAGRPRLALVR